MKKAKRILVLIIVLAMLAGLILPVFVRGEELPEGAVYTTTEEMEDVSAPEDQTVDEDSDSTENENNESVTGEIPGESSEPAETDENSEPAETDGNSEPADSDGSSEPAESDENSETA